MRLRRRPRLPKLTDQEREALADDVAARLAAAFEEILADLAPERAGIAVVPQNQAPDGARWITVRPLNEAAAQFEVACTPTDLTVILADQGCRQEMDLDQHTSVAGTVEQCAELFRAVVQGKYSEELRKSGRFFTHVVGTAATSSGPVTFRTVATKIFGEPETRHYQPY